MKPFYYILSLLILVSSCDKLEKQKSSVSIVDQKFEKTNEVEKVGFLTVFSTTKVKYPILIQTEKSFNHLGDPKNILYRQSDTLKIRIRPYQFIQINNKYAYTDSLIVKQGDTLLLSFLNDTLLKKEIQNKSIKRIQTINYKTPIDKLFSNYIDAFINNYYTINFSDPHEFQFEFSKMKFYKLRVHKESIKSKSQVDDFTSKYDSLWVEYKIKTNDIFKDSRKYVYQDLFLKKKFVDILTLYRFTKNPYLKDYLLSDSFLNRLKNSSNEYAILRMILFDVAYADKADKSRSRRVFNISEIYNDLLNKISDTELVKKARIICLEEMITQGNPLRQVVQQFDRFNMEYSDENFRNYFQAKHLIGLKKKYNSPTELNLLNSNGETISFNDLKSNLKGNVIYVDFWASWCAPCRKAMPASKKIFNEFYDKEKVTFIYLSIDKDKEAWENASKAEGIESYKHSYLILNPDESELMQNLKVSEIPRYMIFDSNGKLVEDNAPGPTNKNIKEEILKYTIK